MHLTSFGAKTRRRVSGDSGGQNGHARGLRRDKLDELLRLCADLDLMVEWEDLGRRRRGEYYRQGDIIVLNLRLTKRQAASSLAHEIAHAEFGDTCSTPAIERRAWEYAAASLIEPDEYEAAEELVGCNPAALAIELDVTPKVVEAWRRWYRTRGPGRPVESVTSDVDDALCPP